MLNLYKYRLTAILLSAVFLFISGNLKAQFNFFDTVRVLASSPVYSYSNPVFQKTSAYYYSYAPVIKLAYVRTATGYSQIVSRNVYFWNYGPEVIISNDSFYNTNPSLTDSMIVYQSLRGGNQDIYFSKYNGSSWSVPAAVVTGSADDINPDIEHSKTGSSQYVCFLAWERNGDIWFKSYYNNTWSADTNLTANISEECHFPKINIIGNYSYQFQIAYLKTVNTNFERLTVIPVTFSTNQFTFSPHTGLVQINRAYNHRFTCNTNNLNYNYDTLGYTNTMDVPMDGFNTGNRKLVTRNQGFNNINGMGSVDNTPITNSPLYFFRGYYAWIKKKTDSTFICGSRGSSYGVESVKYFHLGDQNVNSNFYLSPQISANYYEFRFKLVWEKLLNGKTALYESFAHMFVNNIKVISGETPEGFSLSQNYPNPFNPSTKIRYELPRAGSVRLAVYDVIGREIEMLVNERQAAGSYEATFDGSRFASGVYFCSLKSGNFSETIKLLLIK
ncbi:MAG: T9SS type A sorting domain-containing protein [Ignavibacteriae bacterium]|nr:T9SS type A sorting domain-containing protein [Ignavibacteriota bacterium]